MRAIRKLALTGLFFCFAMVAHTTVQTTPGHLQPAPSALSKVRVDLFLSSTCPHCQKADKFLSDLAAKEGWLDIHRHLINQDKAALETFYQLLQQQNSTNFSVPTLFFCNSRWVGFAEESNPVSTLLRGLNYCRQQLAANASLPPASRVFLQQSAKSYELSLSLVGKPRALFFIPLTAIAEALGSCAIFCVMALFSFLWLCQAPAWQLKAGFSFLAALTLAHYIQQAHAPFFYRAMTGWRFLAAFGGLGLLIFIIRVFMRGFSKKMAYIFIILIALTGFISQIYQQTCTSGIALVFEQWLSSQPFSSSKQCLYRVIYQLIYSLPLALLMLVMIALMKRKYLLNYQQFLTQFSWITLAILAILLVIFPSSLASMAASFSVLLFSFGSAFLTKDKLIFSFSKKTMP